MKHQIRNNDEKTIMPGKIFFPSYFYCEDETIKDKVHIALISTEDFLKLETNQAENHLLTSLGRQTEHFEVTRAQHTNYLV